MFKTIMVPYNIEVCDICEAESKPTIGEGLVTCVYCQKRVCSLCSVKHQDNDVCFTCMSKIIAKHTSKPKGVDKP